MNKELYIKFKATHPDAILPSANNAENGTGDSGYDLVAVEDTKIAASGSNVVEVGLTLADITPGYWIRIEPRSGLGFKHNIQPHLGVIDNGYRGDLGVKLYNFSENDHYVVKKGDKIAQLVMYELLQPKCEWATEVTDTARGEKGFGSSDLTRPPFAFKREYRSWEESPLDSESACDNTHTDTDVVEFPKE